MSSWLRVCLRRKGRQIHMLVKASLDVVARPYDSPLLMHSLEGDGARLGAVKVAHRLVPCLHGCVLRLGLCGILLQPHRVWEGLRGCRVDRQVQNLLALDLQSWQARHAALWVRIQPLQMILQPSNCICSAGRTAAHQLQRQARSPPQCAGAPWKLGTNCWQPQETAHMLLAADDDGNGKCRAAM